MLERARELLPRDPRPLYQLAVASFVADDPAAVLEHLDARAALAPDTPPISQMRYAACKVLGRTGDAIAPLTSLVALTPRDVRLRRERQDLVVQARGFAAAVEDTGSAGQPAVPIVEAFLRGLG